MKSFTLLKGVDRVYSLEVAMKGLSELSLDQTWSLYVKENKITRSEQQNRYLWGLVYKTIAAHLQGWDAEDIHEYCLGEWSGWETVEGFGRKRMKPLRRSSNLNKQEFSDYVDFIQRHMAEKGIVIPDPVLGL